MEMKSVTGPRRRGRARRRRNGFEQFTGLLLPLAAGGGLGYLEAKQPDWWKKVDDKIKAIVLAAVAYVAHRQGMREAAGAASAFCGLYAARAGLAWYEARDKKGKKQLPGLKGLLGDAGMTADAVDRELELALERARGAQAAMAAGGVGAFNNEDLGAISADPIEDGIAARFQAG